MAEVIRITPEETYQKLRAGIALLVLMTVKNSSGTCGWREPFPFPNSGPSCLPSPKIRRSSFTVPEAASTPLPGWQQSSTSKDMQTPRRSWAEWRHGSKPASRYSLPTHESDWL
jgi:hypothetical protein